MAINYFIKGNTATYDRGGYHDISNPLENYHTYTIDWTEDELTWSVDGAVIRTIPKDNAQGYPQSPMAIYAGIWAGGDPDNQPGTIAWAGGITDYSKAPFTMHIKSILVADYSSGKSYSYSDQSGTWESIKAEDGEVNGRYDQAQDDIKNCLVDNLLILVKHHHHLLLLHLLLVQNLLVLLLVHQLPQLLLKMPPPVQLKMLLPVQLKMLLLAQLKIQPLVLLHYPHQVLL